MYLLTILYIIFNFPLKFKVQAYNLFKKKYIKLKNV